MAWQEGHRHGQIILGSAIPEVGDMKSCTDEVRVCACVNILFKFHRDLPKTDTLKMRKCVSTRGDLACHNAT